MRLLYCCYAVAMLLLGNCLMQNQTILDFVHSQSCNRELSKLLGGFVKIVIHTEQNQVEVGQFDSKELNTVL